jgi:hypothetical protein
MAVPVALAARRLRVWPATVALVASVATASVPLRGPVLMARLPVMVVPVVLVVRRPRARPVMVVLVAVVVWVVAAAAVSTASMVCWVPRTAPRAAPVAAVLRVVTEARVVRPVWRRPASTALMPMVVTPASVVTAQRAVSVAMA